MNTEETKPSFWKTLPGIITAIGGLVGAIATLLTALYSAGVFGSKGSSKQETASVQTENKTLPINSTIEEKQTKQQGINPAAVDRTDPKETAYAILETYKAKNLVSLYQYFNETNKEKLPDPSAVGNTHPDYGKVFSGWRWAGVQAWNKSIGDIRYRHYVGTARNEYEAMVKFGELSPLEFLVVVLTYENGKWCFEDINSPSAAHFYEGATEFKLIPESY